MGELLLHPLTKHVLEQAITSSHHALALIGPYGAGKGYLATKLAERLLGDQYKEHKVFRIAAAEAIGIEEIRALQKFLQLKTTGRAAIRRVIIIEDAQTLTIEAQNALLKTLEEPPADTKIILTITDTTSLKKTVYSRLQLIHVHPCTEEQVAEYFKLPQHKRSTVQKAYLISGGYVGLCSALVNDNEHALIDSIEEAKIFLSSNAYERLIEVNVLAKDKEKTMLLLFASKRILSAALQNTKDERTINSLVTRMKIIYAHEHSLRSNPNMKLFLTDLALAL